MIQNFTKSIFTLGLVLIVVTSCKEEEPLPQILAGFSSTSLGLTLDDNNGSVSTEISRTDAAATIITMSITEDPGTEYGIDYSTEPAAVEGVITLEIAGGETSADLVVNKLKNPAFEEVKGFTVNITEVSNDGAAGTNNSLRVTFEENPTSAGAQLNPEVGGPEQPNQVFIDLSKQTTEVIDKDNWDLAFNTGTSNRVTLNYATFAMAKATDQTDLAEVTDAMLTDEFKAQITPGYSTPNINANMDDPNGDLSKTAVAEVSATASENMVYIMNRGTLDTEPVTERGFIKFKVTMDGDNYVITYADLNVVADFSSTTIMKDADYNFSYFSFENGAVNVEPVKADWDIAMSTFLNEFSAGPDIYSIGYKDFVISNYGNVEIDTIIINDVTTYENFTAENIADRNLEDKRLKIGGTWRGSTFNPDFTVDYFVQTNIFYLIKDTDGNHYKLKFTNMFNNEGERGYPEFVYELLTE